MISEQVAVHGCGMFAPGYAGMQAWVQGHANPDDTLPKANNIPPRLRRRTSTLSKALCDAYFDALHAASFSAKDVSSVFGSALGEAAVMISLLDEMWSGDGMLSPMRFATSVHNAAAGTTSIATSNTNFSTSLGADYDTPAMALLEGIGLVLAHDAHVVVCCGDEMINKDLVPDGLRWELLAAAVALGPAHLAPAHLPRLSFVESQTASLVPSDYSMPLRRNPNAGMLDLVDAIGRGTHGTLVLDRGQARRYTVRISQKPNPAA